MSEEIEDDGIAVDVDVPAPQYVVCHNHIILFPYGSEVFSAHLEGLALRIDARDATIEVFDDTDHYWKPAEKNRGNVASIHTGKKP